MNKTFTTSRGIEIEFLPIPTLLEKLQAQHPMPGPPTYTIETATGVKETHPHDETTLETDEDKAAWADYQARLKAATSAFNLALMRLVLLRGIKVEIPEDDGWVREQAFIGIAVPEAPLERRMHWLETEALANESDYMQAVSGVMEASGVPEEVIGEAQATFRGELGSKAAQGAATPPNGHKLGDKPAVRAGTRRSQKRHPRH